MPDRVVVTLPKSVFEEQLVVISGDGWFAQDGNRIPRRGMLGSGGYYQGTLVAAGFQRGQILDFKAMQNEALRELGLQITIPSAIDFS